MNFITATLQLLSLPAAPAAPAPTPASTRRWAVEASGRHMVFSLPPSRPLGARLLAQLADDIDGVRREGFEAVLSCAPGPALESLRKVHFHRFVDVFPSRNAARRWAFAADEAHVRRAA
ncbi:MAG: hypothetical protein AAFY88_04005 [Acidobacteriota bacterium]